MMHIGTKTICGNFLYKNKTTIKVIQLYTTPVRTEVLLL